MNDSYFSVVSLQVATVGTVEMTIVFQVSTSHNVLLRLFSCLRGTQCLHHQGDCHYQPPTGTLISHHPTVDALKVAILEIPKSHLFGASPIPIFPSIAVIHQSNSTLPM